MKVKDLLKELEKFDNDMEVYCAEEYGGIYEIGEISFEIRKWPVDGGSIDILVIA